MGSEVWLHRRRKESSGMGEDERGLSEKDVLVGNGGGVRVGWPNWRTEYLKESGR